MAYNEDSSASGHDEPWIQWFCGLKGHEMFCEVERSYIEDGFNLYGLRACVSNFSDCLDLILDRIGPDDSDDSHLTQSACTLYGLIHARYIITAHGLDAMYNKYAAKEFGTCPLVQCAGQPVLPVGLKDEMGADTVKIFCPKCQCVYHPPPVRSRSSHHNNAGAAGVDGAAFGTTFPHLFLMTFSNLVPDRLPPASAYVPRVFGFRVHSSARQRASASAASVSSTARPPDGKAVMPKRVPFTRRSGSTGDVVKDATQGVKCEDEAAAKEGAPIGQANDVTNDSNVKSTKGAGPSSKQARGDDIKDDEGSRKSKSGKRRNNSTEGDASSKGTGNGVVDSSTSSKRRRKNENGT